MSLYLLSLGGVPTPSLVNSFFSPTASSFWAPFRSTRTPLSAPMRFQFFKRRSFTFQIGMPSGYSSFPPFHFILAPDSVVTTDESFSTATRRGNRLDPRLLKQSSLGLAPTAPWFHFSLLTLSVHMGIRTASLGSFFMSLFPPPPGHGSHMLGDFPEFQILSVLLGASVSHS